jgi:hypothetical protein
MDAYQDELLAGESHEDTACDLTRLSARCLGCFPHQRGKKQLYERRHQEYRGIMDSSSNRKRGTEGVKSAIRGKACWHLGSRK